MACARVDEKLRSGVETSFHLVLRKEVGPLGRLDRRIAIAKVLCKFCEFALAAFARLPPERVPGSELLKILKDQKICRGAV